MAIHSLFPGYIEINYQAQLYGPHVMTRPTRTWLGVPWEGPGTYEAWDGSPVSASIMVDDFIDTLTPLFTSAVTFTSYTIFTQSSPTADAVPVYSEILSGKTGTLVSAIQFATYQKTYSFLTSSNSQAKIILLDVPTGGVISRGQSLSAAETTMVSEFMDITNAWAGRDDARPVAFRSLSNGVNDALKRAYRL